MGRMLKPKPYQSYQTSRICQLSLPVFKSVGTVLSDINVVEAATCMNTNALTRWNRGYLVANWATQDGGLQALALPGKCAFCQCSLKTLLLLLIQCSAFVAKQSFTYIVRANVCVSITVCPLIWEWQYFEGVLTHHELIYPHCRGALPIFQRTFLIFIHPSG